MGGVLVPANTPLYGTVRIEGQRMAVTVNSIESGRWHPLFECGFAPDVGFVCMLASRTLVPWSGISGEGAAKSGHAYFP